MHWFAIVESPLTSRLCSEYCRSGSCGIPFSMKDGDFTSI